MARGVLGVLAMLAAAASLVTGVFLSFNYAPTWEAAHTAVQHVQTEVGLGWLLRGIHHWGGMAAVAFALLEGAQLIYRGGYQWTRRRLWLLGVALFAILIGFAYTGYLLAGDARAYAGVLVLEGLLRATPLAGEELAAIVLGGNSASSATLARIYTVHIVILPALLLLVVAALTAERRRLGLADTRGLLRKHAVAGSLLLVALAALAYVVPPALGDASGPGLPTADEARPEWFFLWVNELLYRVEGSPFFIAAVLPGALLVGAALLPLLRRADALPPAQRRPELLAAGAVAIALIVLTVMSVARPALIADEDDEQTAPPVEPTGAEDPEYDERLTKTLRRFRCARCHVIADDPDGGEDGPPLPLGKDFGELYTRRFFRLKVADPAEFWADTGMNYPKNRKPTPDELAMLEKYFFGD